MYAAIKSKICSHVGCKLPVFASGLCKYHQYERTDGKGLHGNAAIKKSNISTGKRNKPVAKESKKRASINRTYEKRSKNFRAAHPACAIQSPVCTRDTQGVHHVKGKATTELLLDEVFWLPACNACNTWVESHSAWAKENGFKILDGSSKLSKFKK